MKLPHSRILIIVALFCFTTKSFAQLPAAPALATSNVPEASQYGVMYELTIPTSANYNSLASVVYAVNNSSLALNYARIAYFFQLDSKWVWVSMNKFNTTNAQLGVPYANSGIIFQQTVTGMNVYSSVGAGVTNTTGISGNIEIWPDCYNTTNGLGGIGGNTGNYDFNDTRQAASNCYGSFQIHNYGASQTIFAMNNFMGGTLDLGIGNNTGNGNPDWTFMNNSTSYTTTRKLYILVEKGTTIVTQPSTASKNACIGGTISPLTVSTTVNSGTITNYQWYSVATATNTGGTLVATNTTTLTSNSYTPSTAAAGTLYYYCVVNSSGSSVSTSSVSGAQIVGNPVVSISGATAICAGGSVSLTANSSSSPMNYMWSSGATTTVISVSPTITTTYSVAGTSSIGCVGSSTTVTVTVNPRPTIAVSSGSICNGSSFVFSPSGAVTYTFSSGSSTVSPTTTTNYTVSGTSAAGCVGTNTDVSIVVNTIPLVSITGPSSICVGNSASLTAGGADTYTWNTGSNAAGISVSPTTTTSYTLVGTSLAGCTSTMAVKTLTVYALPTLSVTSVNSICAGSSVAITASGASTYTWNTGATTGVLNASPGSTTSYSVSGSSVNGCISSVAAVKTISVVNLPSLSISGTTVICAGATSSLTASGANTYTWNTGANTSGISVSPASTLSYSVTGTNAEGCVSAAAAVVSVSVNPLPSLSISGSTAICIGASASLTANGASSYTWSTGSNAAGVSVSPTITTTYSLNGTSAAGCVNSGAATRLVTVNSLPTVSITSSNSVCAGSSVLLTASGANSYTWNTGATIAAITVTPGSTTTYSVNGSNTFGCSTSVSVVKTISVSTLPILGITGNTVICAGASTSLTANGASTYTWSSGSNAAGISISPVGTTSYTLNGKNADGCAALTAAVIIVSVNILPVVSISGTNAICAGNFATLNANGAASYTWNTGANSSSLVLSPTVTSTYSLIGSSSAGCISAAPATTTLTVHALPVLSITGANTVCEGSALPLMASGASTYTWNTGATTTSVSVTPTTNATYTLTGTSSNGCLSASAAVKSVSLISLPTLTILAPSSICAGTSQSLAADGAQTYTWSTGSTANFITVAPATTTVYTLAGTSSLGCTSASTAVHTLTVYALPVLSINANPTVICVGASASLTASGADTYSWVGIGSSTVIAVSPTVTSDYTLTGISAVGCEGLPVVTSVSVNALPVVSITGTNSACEGYSTSLSAGGASTYTWSGLGSSTSILVSPTVTSVYTVTGTDAAGCEQSVIHTLSVNALPSLSITGSSGICTGQSASLSVSGASTYSWSTGSTNASIITTPSVSTVYSVTGTDALGCTQTSTQAVNVAATLSVSITGPATICEGDIFSLTANGASTYTWNTNDATQAITPNPTVTTTYSVIGATGTCSNTATATVIVNSNPTLTISGLNALCSGDSTVLIVAGADTFTWSTSSTSSSIIVAPGATSGYSVAGQFTTGCTAIASTTVTVNPLPTITISGDSVVCSGSSIVLSANGALTYTWNTTAVSNSISVSPTSTGSFGVMGTDTNGCMNSSASANVTVHPVPAISVIGSASVICEGDSVTLTASGADTYVWDNTSTDTSIVVVPAASTSYSVIGTNSFACSSTAQFTVSVNALPIISINGPTVICTNESATIIASGAATYSWSNGDTSDTLVVTPSATSGYSITGVSNEGCVATTALQMEVSECTGLMGLTGPNTLRIFPNPSSSVLNVEFSNVTDVQIEIRNVLGQVVKTISLDQSNTIHIQDLSSGMYTISVSKNNQVLSSTSFIKN